MTVVLESDDPSLPDHQYSRGARYDEHAVLQTHVGNSMLERLDYIQIQPKTVLDAGCVTGLFTQHLQTRYPSAQVIGLDSSLAMLQQAHQREQHGQHWLQADLSYIPLENTSVDLVFSNMLVHESESLTQRLKEWYRVLKPNGMLLFTTLGPDTLYELRQSWQSVDQYRHVNTFLDMHHVGDTLLKAGFHAPVTDVHHLTMTYPTLNQLLADLKYAATRITTGQKKGLMTPRQRQQLEQAYQAYTNPDAPMPATYEIIHGHAIKPPPSSNEAHTFSFPIEQLRSPR